MTPAMVVVLNWNQISPPLSPGKVGNSSVASDFRNVITLSNRSEKESVSLFDLILYVPSTIFQLNRDGSSWVEPVLS